MTLTSRIRTVLVVALLLYSFLVGLEALGEGFKLLGRDAIQAFFSATSNPFAGLAVGILTTSVVQSSSVTTSMVVALVANPAAPLPIANAVPMIMGANIGTTVTNTLVSFGHVTRPEEFRRAMAFGTLDDFFNLCALIVLLPLEIAFAPLERMSAWLVAWIPNVEGAALPNPIKTAASAIVQPMNAVLTDLFSPVGAGVALLLIAAITIFSTLRLLVLRLEAVGHDRVRALVSTALGSRPWRGFILGAGATAAVQSSSVVLSLLVPLAGTGAMTLAQGFPVALGANVGTTATALIAAAGAASTALYPAVQIALVHLLFNLLGTLLIYPGPRFREVPLRLAQWIADVAVRSKTRAVLYLVLIFYGIPALGLVLFSI